MKRLTQLFQQKTSDILNVYFTAGYPKRDSTTTILKALEEAGADMIEIGMPYSDPLADGPTIQESGSQAIRNGMTLPLLFEQLASIRAAVNIPLILMGYLNQVLQYGFDQFLEDCQRVGIDGLILPDLPLYEYQKLYQSKVEAAGLGISFLITPQTSTERIQKVDELSRGFIYMVSSAAITGGKNTISEQQVEYFERITNMKLQNPCLIGFGISDHETFSKACDYASGAIIGSAFIRALANAEDSRKATLDFVKSIRNEEILTS